MRPKGSHSGEAIIEAAELPAIAIGLFVVGHADTCMPLAVKAQVVTSDARRRFQRTPRGVAASHREAVAGGGRVAAVVLHEALAVIGRHPGVVIDRHRGSCKGVVMAQTARHARCRASWGESSSPVNNFKSMGGFIAALTGTRYHSISLDITRYHSSARGVADGQRGVA
ncbi:hypothetical protein MB84_29080 (plasmid) [Pandoraea oxalativorans]|uniref:Uncharacterized protein n=2 Tax=Pandoraea oxalativorans TaxID=573737 RepID=A0A0G3ICB1_9BURK|nr:hypothetical protein MB84_29080 [Pandoraea oxalativorans]